MMVSIIIPVFNEEASVSQVLRAVAALPLDKEILVVNDGSQDKTGEILRALRSQIPFKLLEHSLNQGKGAAIQTALRQAQGQAVVIQDADLEYDCRQIMELVRPIQEEKADVVFGSRFLTANPNLYKRYLWGNKFLTFVVNVLCRAHITDSYTCYKAIRTPLARSLGLKSRGFEIEAEIAVKVLRSQARFQEIPISYQPRSLEEGKKIGWKDAAKGFYTILATWWFWPNP